MNWTAHHTEVPGGRQVALRCDERAASFGDVLRALRDDAGFRAWFNDLLAELPFRAFRWETPGATDATAGRACEFVALDAPYLTGKPDPEAFAEHFRAAPGAPAVAFPNLGGDSTLIAPAPISGPAAYGHLAAFVRGAPEAQRDALWKLVGEEVLRRLGPKPVWLSAAGAGVPWLHVRLDDRPKYYGHRPYTQNPT